MIARDGIYIGKVPVEATWATPEHFIYFFFFNVSSIIAVVTQGEPRGWRWLWFIPPASRLTKTWPSQIHTVCMRFMGNVRVQSRVHGNWILMWRPKCNWLFRDLAVRLSHSVRCIYSIWALNTYYISCLIPFRMQPMQPNPKLCCRSDVVTVICGASAS